MSTAALVRLVTGLLRVGPYADGVREDDLEKVARIAVDACLADAPERSVAALERELADTRSTLSKVKAEGYGVAAERKRIADLMDDLALTADEMTTWRDLFSEVRRLIFPCGETTR